MNYVHEHLRAFRASTPGALAGGSGLSAGNDQHPHHGRGLDSLRYELLVCRQPGEKFCDAGDKGTRPRSDVGSTNLPDLARAVGQVAGTSLRGASFPAVRLLNPDYRVARGSNIVSEGRRQPRSGSGDDQRGVVTQAATASPRCRTMPWRMSATFAGAKPPALRIATPDRVDQPQPAYRYADNKTNKTPEITDIIASNQVVVLFPSAISKRAGAVLDTLVAQGANQMNAAMLRWKSPLRIWNAARTKAIRTTGAGLIFRPRASPPAYCQRYPFISEACG